MASRTPDGQPIDPVENRRRMAAGELYYSFTPELIADRQKCQVARDKYNEVSKEKVSRRSSFSFSTSWRVICPHYRWWLPRLKMTMRYSKNIHGSMAR
ncbi:hypothetical protein MCOR27_001184 [Pyricularia oryzae]|nr:hypothetical protein MCOR01_001658 [Pyricularia oryzae]KAI6267752.1 hypothetical protein MCOR26_009552 [Pyricularia oryzae]KAI6287819.1 hypothetical protein MCOR27_001184 [Pyricularia oryzae]KAI6317618.1 hypothetical protein MCOR30_009037 [Pyricularia oryzae]KAI6335559.1 hypothetical protein MCOR28_009640 [Pyricularia oryzae]